jgi:hypothetical protein
VVSVVAIGIRLTVYTGVPVGGKKEEWVAPYPDLSPARGRKETMASPPTLLHQVEKGQTAGRA